MATDERDDSGGAGTGAMAAPLRLPAVPSRENRVSAKSSTPKALKSKPPFPGPSSATRQNKSKCMFCYAQFVVVSLRCCLTALVLLLFSQRRDPEVHRVDAEKHLGRRLGLRPQRHLRGQQHLGTARASPRHAQVSTRNRPCPRARGAARTRRQIQKCTVR